MTERGYSIALKLDGTRLCASLLEDDGDGGGWEVSGDNVDLEPLLATALRAAEARGYERAREQAAGLMDTWDYHGHAEAIRSMEDNPNA